MAFHAGALAGNIQERFAILSVMTQFDGTEKLINNKTLNLNEEKSKLPLKYDLRWIPHDKHRTQLGSARILHHQCLTAWQQSLLRSQPTDFSIYPIPVEITERKDHQYLMNFKRKYLQVTSKLSQGLCFHSFPDPFM